MAAIDLSLQERSITARVEPLISNMSRMNLDQIKEAFQTILNDETTYASEHTRKKWLDTIKNSTNKNKLMFTITNLYLAGADMSVTSDKKDNIGFLIQPSYRNS